MIFKTLYCFSLRNYAKKVKGQKNVVVSNSGDVVIKHRKVSHSLKHYELISEYFSSKSCLREVKEKIPSHYMLKKFKYPNSMFIVDSDVASHMFKLLQPYLESSKGHILEVNAGLGIFTTKLLEHNVRRLHIYESDVAFHKSLFLEIQKNKNDAKLYRTNLLMLWNMIIRDRGDNEKRFEAAFDGLPCLSWEDDPVMKIILTIPSDNFILHIIYSIIFESGICTYGRPELFVTMPPFIYNKLTSTPESGNFTYLSKSVLFQLLFDNTILGEVPQKAFVPWLTKRQRRSTNQTKKDEDIMYLVKITARQDLLKRIPPHLLKPLWFFVRQMMQKRTARFICSMEDWLPGCGPRLISKGFTIYTKCGSIMPEDYLNIFLDFSSWPEFDSCSFLPTMESLLVKMSDPGLAEEIMTETNNCNEDISKEGENIYMVDNKA